MKYVCRVFGVFALGVFFAATLAMGADAVGGRIALHLAGGEVQGGRKVVRVKQGEGVRLALTSDLRAEVHLHGYDLEREVRPGEVAVMEFRARVAGRFPATLHASHSHEPAKGGAHGEKVLFYLEVHP